MTTNPNDAIRSQILQYFYDRNDTATSRYGKRGSAAKISDVKRDLKSLHGLKQQQVMANLTYLIDKGWINTVEVEKTVRVSGGTVPSVVTWYEISADGIDKLEGESDFKNVGRYAGINIVATGENTITLGDGNIVNAEFSDLHHEVDLLKDAVSNSTGLTDAEKLDIAIDIETLKDQLAKSKPDPGVVSKLWSSISHGVTAAEFVDYVTKVGVLIKPLIA